jgi:hypothetical protein
MAEQRPADDSGMSAPARDAVQEVLPLTEPAEKDVPPFPIALLALAEISSVGYRALYALVDTYGGELGRILVSPVEQTVSVPETRPAAVT